MRTATGGSGGLLTVKQAAQMLSVSTMTVRRLIRRGTLPAWRVGGKDGPIRIESGDVEKLRVPIAPAEGINDPMMPVIGQMVTNAQIPPSGLTDDQALHWRTGYQNALSDLIAELFPGQGGGRRLTAPEIAEGDTIRETL